MIDITKPLELEDGTSVILVSSDHRWIKVRVPEKYADSGTSPTRLERLFRRFSGLHITRSIPSLRNKKEMKMIDTNKAVQVNGRDAKIIHTFDNGNLAVVADSDTNVLTFTKYGCLVSGTAGSVLTNKPVETVVFLGIWPSEPYNRRQVFKYANEYLAREAGPKANTIHQYLGYMLIKQTMVDGVVVGAEILPAVI